MKKICTKCYKGHTINEIKEAISRHPFLDVAWPPIEEGKEQREIVTSFGSGLDVVKFIWVENKWWPYETTSENFYQCRCKKG